MELDSTVVTSTSFNRATARPSPSAKLPSFQSPLESVWCQEDGSRAAEPFAAEEKEASDVTVVPLVNYSFLIENPLSVWPRLLSFRQSWPPSSSRFGTLYYSRSKSNVSLQQPSSCHVIQVRFAGQSLPLFRIRTLCEEESLMYIYNVYV